jgi:Hint domain
MVAASELPINTNASAMQMAQAIFGDGVTIEGASYFGSNNSSGIYSNGDSVTSGVTPSDTGVILSTGDARDFTNSSGSSNQSNSTSSSTNAGRNSNDNLSSFNSAAGARTYDAAYLDVDFTPTGDTLTMQFVFSSEEYPEFTNSQYQDFIGVWVNGSFVDVSVGSGSVNPSNLNNSDNENLFFNNANDDYNTEMDGFTVTMTLTMNVIPNATNTIRIGIADVLDSSYDSNLLIAADSLQTVLIAHDDRFSLPDPNQVKTIDVLSNDVGPNGSTLTITHINGVAVTAGSTVTLNTGQTVTLNADGTFTLVGDNAAEDFNFTYTIDDGTNTDVAYVIVDSVPCFVRGTRILTERGHVPVEELTLDDLVQTRDNGFQPLRWIGNRVIAAQGKHAPIRIRADTFGAHNELWVSPLHRVLIRDSLAELLFGEYEVLVTARDLVNDNSVTVVEGREVEYFHLLFDQHEVIYSEGLPTESFLPGPQLANSFEEEVAAEIYDLFPEIDPATGLGYSPAARRTLKPFEAQLLCAFEAQVA